MRDILKMTFFMRIFNRIHIIVVIDICAISRFLLEIKILQKIDKIEHKIVNKTE